MIASRSEITVRPYESGDELGILTSFNLVFRRVCGEAFENRDLLAWRWRFLANPCGHRIWVAATPDGTIAAHYGGIATHVDSELGDRVFSQAVDCFAHPDYQRGLQKTGIFVDAGRQWFDDCRVRGDAVTFGYPVEANERIGKRMMDYAHLCTVDYLCSEVADAAPSAPTEIEVARVAAPSADHDALRDRHAAKKRCLVRRDAAYVSWRYAKWPLPIYELWEARRRGALAGVMVLRPIHELVPGGCTVADWIVPEDDVAAADALLARAHARAAEAGRRILVAVFPDWSPERAGLLARGFAIVASSHWLERRLAHRSFDPLMTSEWLRESWWFTLGDSDLV